MKKGISILLTVIMLLSLLPMAAFAEELNQPTLTVDSVYAAPGDTVSINVKLSNNPGLVSMGIDVDFDEGLTLTGATNGSTFPAYISCTMPKQLSTVGKVTDSCIFAWSGTDIDDADIKDGVILTLEFKVSDDAEIDNSYAVRITPKDGNCIDKNLQSVDVNGAQGEITVIDFTPGDANDDGLISLLDTVMISRYIVDGCKYDPDGYAIRLNEDAANVNDDGLISLLDTVMISRYIVDGCKTDPEGYNIELKRPTKKCQHEMQATEAKAATCTEDGNIPYWYCSKCEKYFSDANGSRAITLDDTVVKAKGHTVVIDPYVAPTDTTPGRTEGSHCSVCSKVIIAPEPIPIPTADAYTIIYELFDGNDYLKSQALDNSKNPTTLKCSERKPLTPLACPGFKFLGWFELGEDKPINLLEAGKMQKGEVLYLYAHWEEKVFDITYNTYQTPVTSSPTEEQLHYTVSKGNHNLYNPEINNYKFLGWYDDKGIEYKNIPVGTTENIVLNAYYTSLRNLAFSVNDNNPIVLEDTNEGVVYFTYEIGEIRHVPIKQIGDTIQSVAGLKQIKEETVSTTIQETEADTVSNTISNMAVKSDTWTLSENWNDVTTVNESWAESIGKTSSQAKTDATTSSGTLSLTSQNGGSSYHKSEDGSTVYDYDSKTETKDKGHTFDASINGSIANKVEANLGNATENGTNKNTKTGLTSHTKKETDTAGVSVNSGWEVNAGLEYGYHNTTNTVTKTGTDKVTVNSNIDENTSSWNNAETFSATNTHSSSTTVTNTLSDIITTTKNYGTSYSKGGSDTTTQGFSSSESSTTGSSSTLTWSKLKTESKTTTYEVNGKIEGKYRQILVGKAHVFGVVGYDFNTKSYFTYTFTVMDDETEIWLDYTPKDGDFHDCENSCVPFEIPIDIFEYVSGKIAKTKGVQYTTNSLKGTARIVNYVGTDKDVIVPTYVSDSKQFYKVTEIAPSAFAGKTVHNVILGNYITSIPDGAFKNCTELEGVIGKFTEIGDNAFSGCENLTNMNIPSNVTKIGTDAFKGAKSITVRAMNDVVARDLAKKQLPEDSKPEEVEEESKRITAEFIKSVIDCGADNINLDISYIAEGTQLALEVGNIESFNISGDRKTYNGFSLKSFAKETSISEMNIVNTSGIPLNIGSDTLTLYKVYVQSNNIALLMRKDGAKLLLNQDSSISTNGENAIISKNPVIVSYVGEDDDLGSLTVIGDLRYVNTITGSEYVEVTNGKIHDLADEEFQKYLLGQSIINFDYNGATISGVETKAVYYGEEYGTLPTPTRDYYTFDGWYTEKEGGEKVTEETICNDATDITLYAHWTQNPLSDWVKKSDMPGDAQIEQTKWTYTQRSFKDSGNSKETGWTYDSKSISSYSSEKGPVYSDPTGNDRKVRKSQYVSSSNYKTVYCYYRDTLSETDTGNTCWGYSNSYRHYYDLDVELKETDGSGGGKTLYKYWYEAANPNTHSGHYKLVFSNGTKQVKVSDNYSPCWYYQDPIYTYHYHKDEDKELDTYPSGSNISNIVEWVQYRNK